jgi:hypothetical protein
VAADAVALPHLVHPGRNGLLYRPGDVAGLAAALTALPRDPAARSRMGAAGREAAAAHDLDATLDAFEDVYADVRRGAARFRACTPSAAWGSGATRPSAPRTIEKIPLRRSGVPGVPARHHLEKSW